MRKETVLICLSDDSVEENKVRINKGNILIIIFYFVFY